MFNIYISQRGLESIACGVMLGAIMYDNESDLRYLQAKNIQINSLKTDKLIDSIGGNYTVLYDHVSFDYSELDMIRKIRYTAENLVCSLLSKLSINLKDCNLIIDKTLPKLTLGNVIKANSTKIYPMIHMTRLLIESERRKFITKLDILYPRYKFNITQGRISSNHLAVITRLGVSKVHKPYTAEILTEYLIKLYLSESPKRDDYLVFYRKKLPSWWKEQLLKCIGLNVDNILDLIPKDKLESVSYIKRPYNSLNHVRRINPFSLPDEYLQWFEQNAPSDLKYEILL